jgi:cytochrome c2
MRHHPAPAAIAFLHLTILLAGCGQRSDPPAAGDPEAGAVLLAAHGCGSCHSIPGVIGADGTIGPPLDGFAGRPFIAGKLPNQLQHLTRWIRTPQTIEPGTAMPNLPVNQAEAYAMAAYLYTLR